MREDEGLKKRLNRLGVTVGGLLGFLLRDDGGGGDEGKAGDEGSSWLLKMWSLGGIELLSSISIIGLCAEGVQR